MKLIRFHGNGDEELDPEELHLIGAGQGEHTLCGDTLDNDSKTAGSWEYVTAGAVTCQRCIAIILHCRGKRIRVPWY